MDAITLTKKLVSLPSFVDGSGDEGPVAGFLYSYLKTYLPWLALSKQFVTGKRYNIIALAKGKQNSVFISHMDTVNPTGNKSERLTPRISSGRLYGLGACDMKAGLAASLTAVREAGPSSGSSLLFDCDEEYYFAGAKKLFPSLKIKPGIAVFPEPTGLKILNGCRGLMEAEIILLGKTAHASQPNKGKNAAMLSVPFIQSLRESLGKMDTRSLGKTTVNLSAMQAGINKGSDIAIQANAVPDIAKLVLDIRTSSTSMTDAVFNNTLKKAANGAGLKIERVSLRLNYPPYLCDKKRLKIFEKSVTAIAGSARYLPLKSTGFFEASFASREWGCPAIAFGPGDSAHEANEYVALQDIESTRRVFASYIG